MPKVTVNNITMNMTSRERRPLILIPYLAADHACYAFQVPGRKHFTCISSTCVELANRTIHWGAIRRNSSPTMSPRHPAMWASARHMSPVCLRWRCRHVAGGKHGQGVASLSVHSGWAKTDACANGRDSWQIRRTPSAFRDDHPTIFRGVRPSPPEKPDTSRLTTSSAAGCRSVPAFIQQSMPFSPRRERTSGCRADANHGQTSRQLTSTRFADRLKSGIRFEPLISTGARAAPTRIAELACGLLMRRHAGAAVAQQRRKNPSRI